MRLHVSLNPQYIPSKDYLDTEEQAYARKSFVDLYRRVVSRQTGVFLRKRLKEVASNYEVDVKWLEAMLALETVRMHFLDIRHELDRLPKTEKIQAKPSQPSPPP